MVLWVVTCWDFFLAGRSNFQQRLCPTHRPCGFCINLTIRHPLLFCEFCMHWTLDSFSPVSCWLDAKLCYNCLLAAAWYLVHSRVSRNRKQIKGWTQSKIKHSKSLNSDLLHGFARLHVLWCNPLPIRSCWHGCFGLQLFSKVTGVITVVFVTPGLGISPTPLFDLSATFRVILRP